MQTGWESFTVVFVWGLAGKLHTAMVRTWGTCARTVCTRRPTECYEPACNALRREPMAVVSILATCLKKKKSFAGQVKQEVQKVKQQQAYQVFNTAVVCLFVGCLTSQQHASVSQGWICSDNFTCCHTEIEVADQTFYLTQSQYTDTGLTSPSVDPITPGAWQGSHWSANF